MSRAQAVWAAEIARQATQLGALLRDREADFPGLTADVRWLMGAYARKALLPLAAQPEISVPLPGEHCSEQGVGVDPQPRDCATLLMSARDRASTTEAPPDAPANGRNTMRNCLNPACRLELLEDASCGCGWDNSGEELQEAALLGAEATMVGGSLGAVLRAEAQAERQEAFVEEVTELAEAVAEIL